MITQNRSYVSKFLPTWFSTNRKRRRNWVRSGCENLICALVTRFDKEDKARECPTEKRNQKDDSDYSMNASYSHGQLEGYRFAGGVQSAGASGHTSSGETGFD